MIEIDDIRTQLYLIRHGEAISNVEPIIGGMRGDAGLTPFGVRQAEALRDRLAGSHEIQADVLIASTLARARQTADIIAPALGLTPIPDDDVHELRPGEADGMHVGDFKAKYGEPDFRSHPFWPLSPGGENWGQFVLRVAMALDRITLDHLGKTIVVVCHGGVIDASFITFFRMGSLLPPPATFSTHNTSITQWTRFDTRNAPTRWRLEGYNDAVHLRSLGKNEPIRWRDIPPTGQPEHQSVPLPTESYDEDY